MYVLCAKKFFAYKWHFIFPILKIAPEWLKTNSFLKLFCFSVSIEVEMIRMRGFFNDTFRESTKLCLIFLSKLKHHGHYENSNSLMTHVFHFILSQHRPNVKQLFFSLLEFGAVVTFLVGYSFCVCTNAFRLFCHTKSPNIVVCTRTKSNECVFNWHPFR